MSEEKASVIQSNVGPLQFGLRYKEGGIPQTYWFTFDDSDIERSREILSEDRELKFDVKCASPPEGVNFYVHLGRNLNTCEAEDDLSIRLRRDTPSRWRPKTGWIDEDTPSDVERIKCFHWRAAYARATLCKGPGDPVCFEDGTPVQTKIALGYPDEWYENMYHTLLERLSADRPEANLTSSFSLFLHSLKRARERAEGSSALELYYRLQRILKAYEQSLTRILRNPSTQISPKVSFFDVDPEQASQFYAGGREVQIHEAHEVTVRNGTPVPLSFVGSEAEHSLDNEANRFAARSIRKVRKLIRKVEDSLIDYIESEKNANKRFLAQENGSTNSPIYQKREKSIVRHQEKADRVSQAKKRFGHYAQKLPGDGTMPQTATTSAAMYYDTRYAKLRQLTNLLDFTLRFVDTDESSVPFEVDAFHALYERWCFVKVVEALTEIGFSFGRNGEPETVPFYHHPVPHQCNCKMWSDRTPGVKLEVWYERRYPKYKSGEKQLYGLETRYREGRTSYKHVNPNNWKPKVTPDITLEFKDQHSSSPVPEIVTLDPTLGEVKPSKYEYLEAIRAFNETEPNSRESKRIVRAAWGIHPGPNRQDLDSYIEIDQKNDYSKGFIRLRPTEGSTNSLPEILDQILHEVGLFEETD